MNEQQLQALQLAASSYLLAKHHLLDLLIEHDYQVIEVGDDVTFTYAVHPQYEELFLQFGAYDCNADNWVLEVVGKLPPPHAVLPLGSTL
jgi:hypothetical protein